VFCSKGVNTSQKTLKFVDWSCVKNNPKIFMGLSDITVYLNAINTKTKLITFHGNEITNGFAQQFKKYSKNEFEEILIHGKLKEIKPNKKRKTIIKGKTTGRIIGGNLRCLLKLKNTMFWPNFENKILLIEAFHLTPKECKSMFEILKKQKVFEKINGIIIGHIYGMQIENPKKEQMEKIILEFIKDKPILKCEDFGHNTPNCIFPIGAKILLDATNKKIKLIEEYLI
jgi:muramoyltetrapeptide carboxypeptidase